MNWEKSGSPPLDGTEFLVYRPGEGFFLVYGQENGKFCESFTGIVLTGGFTHWMRLPPPPATKGEQA